MQSPFPGMDPYLEAHWRDVHARLILYACDQLESSLPASLIARVEERVVVEPDEGESRSIYPDVRVVEHRRNGGSGVAAKSATAIAEPVVVHYESEPGTETFLHIREATGKQRLISVVEVLGLSNKLPGESRTSYRQKQRELRQASVSLVEIDLLRAGQRIFSLPASMIPRKLHATYQVCVRRGWKANDYEIYAAPLRQSLPTIRIPLRESDDDAQLDLQTLIDLVYRKGRYFATINYREAPEPPLSAADATWARGLLRKKMSAPGA